MAQLEMAGQRARDAGTDENYFAGTAGLRKEMSSSPKGERVEEFYPSSPAARRYTSSFHGDRISRRSRLLASASSNCCLTGSHASFFPVCKAMTPRWQTLTERK